MEYRRVVVTGFGGITPLGGTIGETWKRVVSGAPHFHRVNGFDVTGLPTQIASQIAEYSLSDFDSATAKKIMKRSGVAAHYTAIVAREALKQARLLTSEGRIPERFCHQTGVYIGTGGGFPEEVAQCAYELAKRRAWGASTSENEKIRFARQFAKQNFNSVLRILADSAPAVVSIAFGAQGGMVSSTQACATGAGNIEQAWKELRDPESDLDIIVAGGADAITEIGFWVFAVVGATTKRNDDPMRASRPFDKERDGFLMSEGAGILILEEYEHAKNRDAPILGEILGCAKTCDAKGYTDPDTLMQTLAITRALKKARVGPEEIDYINAHGTSTPRGDASETQAIKNVFGKRAYRIPVSSTKSVTGHTLGAAGALESIFCLLAMRDMIVPPTINYESQDPDCDLDYVPNIARCRNTQIALNLSFGFFGQNVAIVLGRGSE